MQKYLHNLGKHLFDYTDAFLCLFYPRLCMACGVKAPPYGQEICFSCSVNLPKTDYHLQKENPFTECFWGRVNIQAGAAMYLFKKGSRAQNLIHNIKYKGKHQIAVTLGNMYGRKLKDSPYFKDIEAIVPVPLHWKKERARGFNQSAKFGQGLAEVLDIPMMAKGLKRIVHSPSQTQMSRQERIANVMKAFDLNQPKNLEGKHILLVDDVLTTGATLEACSTKILQLPNTKVSMATIVMASDF